LDDRDAVIESEARRRLLASFCPEMLQTDRRIDRGAKGREAFSGLILATYVLGVSKNRLVFGRGNGGHVPVTAGSFATENAPKYTTSRVIVF